MGECCQYPHDPEGLYTSRDLLPGLLEAMETIRAKCDIADSAQVAYELIRARADELERGE